MIKFYVTTKMGGKDINPIRETFTAQVTKEEVPALVKTYIEEFNKRVTPAYKRDLISIEYDGDTSLKLFSESTKLIVPEEESTSEEQHPVEPVQQDNTIYIDSHDFIVTKDWYINTRGTKCRNLKCKYCEVTGKQKEDSEGNITFVYDEKYQAKKWRVCTR